MTLFSMPFVFIFTLGVGGATLSRLTPRPLVREGKRFVLRPEQIISRQWKFGALAMGVWYGVGILVFAYYWMTARPAQATAATITFAIYGALGLIPIRGTWRAYRLSRRT